MSFWQTFHEQDFAAVGNDLHRFAAELYPICRSITGAGVRQTLDAIGKRVPLRITEIPTGTEVLDWTIPKEWNIRDAYIANSRGERVVDFRHSNLHVLNYSVPVRRRLTLAELKQHLFTIPQNPDWIPYRTSYYQETWGFCLPHQQMLALEEGDYDVVIDATLEAGQLTYGECYLPGETSEEVLISSHVCHPSLANDNLSAIAVSVFLAELLAKHKRRYSYRFLYAPGTIGAISWLARNPDAAHRVQHGLVLAGIGDEGGFHYKKSRRGDAVVDRAVEHVVRQAAQRSEVMDFSPMGYDERQFDSPGFNLPMGCLMRSLWGTFPEYHTSADNLDFIRPGQLAESLGVCIAVTDILEHNRRYQNLFPCGEPQLGRRELYGSLGGQPAGDQIAARLWVLNLSDGEHDLLAIAHRSGLPFAAIRDAAALLLDKGLLREV